jgi:DNA repair protein RecO (recombination protein O)
MSTKVQGIVLSKVEYGDSALIIDLYCKEKGRLSVNTYSSKKKNNRFFFAPLSLLNISFYQSKKGKFLKIKEVESALANQMISRDSELHAIRYFIAEVLKNTLKEEDSSPYLYEFLKTEIESLYTTDKKGSFVINFLENLSPFLGFDLNELRRAGGKASDYGFDFSDSDWNALLCETREERVGNKAYLSLLLKYYANHFDGMGALKSKSVLAEVFG